MNADHAFAEGLSYANPRRTIFKQQILSPFLRKFYRFLRYLLKAAQVDYAWDSFIKGANYSEDFRIGPDAFCINLQSRESIQISSGVVCRGVLRLGDLGPAKLVIGRNVYIGDNTLINCATSITIGDDTLIAHGVQILDNNSHPSDSAERERDWAVISGRTKGDRSEVASAPIEIHENVWIGFNAVIFKGVKIGARSVIAAYSVVTSDVPAGTLVAGNPARFVKTVE